MSLSHASAPADNVRIAPVHLRDASLFCLALLTVAGALASLALAWATPFAAFAVLAAAMLPLSSAFLVMADVWLVNQAIMFGALDYPIEANTILWGLVTGTAAFVATLVAASVLRILPPGRTPLALALALNCAFCSYELVLLAVTPFLGGGNGLTVPIITRLGLLNAAWLIGLAAVCEGVRLFNSVRGYAPS